MEVEELGSRITYVRIQELKPEGDSMAAMHDIDYKIFGDDMQFVEVELDPGEATVAEAGG
jgi:hypothetical protein